MKRIAPVLAWSPFWQRCVCMCMLPSNLKFPECLSCPHPSLWPVHNLDCLKSCSHHVFALFCGNQEVLNSWAHPTLILFQRNISVALPEAYSGLPISAVCFLLHRVRQVSSGVKVFTVNDLPLTCPWLLRLRMTVSNPHNGG
eukprot:1142799-Pelagomonas_calceolata.AAC.8